MYKISRLVYAFYKEKIKEGNVILHTCDNPRCINPNHLIQGTHQDNMQDKKLKGRSKNENSHKTHCKYGHSLEDAKVYFNKKTNNQMRQCKKCLAKKLTKKS